jgi:membrane protein
VPPPGGTASPTATSDPSSAPSSTAKATDPPPDDPRKPSSPPDLARPSWGYVARRTVREFLDDQCPDLAAALTFYAVLAVAPALLALTSVLGLVGDPQATIDRLLRLAQDVGPAGAVDTLEPILDQLTSAPAAGFAFVLGLVVAIWSASGYVVAFSRGMNRVYEVDEGRPFWKLRPALLLVTVTLIVLAVLVVSAVVLSGSVVRSVGANVGLGGPAVTVWEVLRWPLVVVLVVVAIALLYHATPNVRQPKFRWVSVGALLALVVWVLASLGLGLYVTRFANYDRTYGSLAGVIVLLLWLWVTNLALLLGGELDSEMERGRQLQGGIEAEQTLRLPPKDTRASERRQEKEAEDVRRGRALREEHGADRTTAGGARADSGTHAGSASGDEPTGPRG